MAPELAGTLVGVSLRKGSHGPQRDAVPGPALAPSEPQCPTSKICGPRPLHQLCSHDALAQTWGQVPSGLGASLTRGGPSSCSEQLR